MTWLASSWYHVIVASLSSALRTSGAFSILKSNVGLDDGWEESDEADLSEDERNDHISQH